MMTTLLSLLGGGLGGLLRFVPEIFRLIADQRDRDHEYRMTELQRQIDEARAKQQIDVAHAQGEMLVAGKEMDAFVEAVKGQWQPTGVPWVDALSASVRPVVTYWWMALFTVYKMAMFVIASIEIYIALRAIETLAQAIPVLGKFVDTVWTPQDAGILAMILGFWFVDRSIRKNTGR